MFLFCNVYICVPTDLKTLPPFEKVYTFEKKMHFGYRQLIAHCRTIDKTIKSKVTKIKRLKGRDNKEGRNMRVPKQKILFGHSDLFLFSVSYRLVLTVFDLFSVASLHWNYGYAIKYIKTTKENKNV